MAYTPVELRHVRVSRSLFGYNKAAVEQLLDEVADMPLEKQTAGGASSIAPRARSSVNPAWTRPHNWRVNVTKASARITRRRWMGRRHQGVCASTVPTSATDKGIRPWLRSSCLAKRGVSDSIHPWVD